MELTKLTKRSTWPKTMEQALKARAKDLDNIIDDLEDGTSTSVDLSSLKVDTISESTSGSGVTIDGVLLKDGEITASLIIDESVQELAAAGNSQATGGAITDSIVVVTAADGTTGVVLPTAAEGLNVTVINNDADILKIYPNTSDKINEGSANAAISVVGYSVTTFNAKDATDWYSNSRAINADTISESTAAAGVTIDSVKLKDGGIICADAATLEVDTINEATAGNGVVIDGVLLKDNAIQTDNIYDYTNGVGVDIESVIIKDGLIKTSANAGTVNTGVTAVEYGDGYNHTTVLTISQQDALTVADNVALSDGYLLYTLPAGACVINSAYMSVGVTLAEDTTATPEVGLGTTIGSGAVATLGAVDAAAENIITAQSAAACDGTATVKTIADQVLVIETGDDHTVHFNVAATWADTAGTDLTGDIAGTVVLNWSFMA